MNTILQGWDAGRIVRLAISLGLGVYAVVIHDTLLLMLAGFVLLQALMNVSCCGSGGCPAGNDNSSKEVYKDQIEPYRPENK